MRLASAVQLAGGEDGAVGGDEGLAVGVGGGDGRKKPVRRQVSDTPSD